MRIIDKRVDKLRTIDTLKKGDTFLIEDDLFMVIECKLDLVEVVELETAYHTSFYKTELVTPVIVECRIIQDY